MEGLFISLSTYANGRYYIQQIKYPFRISMKFDREILEIIDKINVFTTRFLFLFEQTILNKGAIC